MTLLLPDGRTESLPVERPPIKGESGNVPPEHIFYSWVSYDQDKLVFVREDLTAKVSHLHPALRANLEKILSDNGAPRQQAPSSQSLALPVKRYRTLGAEFWIRALMLFNRMRDHHAQYGMHRPSQFTVEPDSRYVPGRAPIEGQLARMLSRPRFGVQHVKLGKVLEYLVKATLENRTLRSEDIQRDLFQDARPPKDDPTVNARNAANRLRKIVSGYYTDEGRQDPILIRLPSPREGVASKGKSRKFQLGESYRLVFRYQAKSPLAQKFTMADTLVMGSRAMRLRGVQVLREIQRDEPNHPDAILMLAEAIGRSALEIFDGKSDVDDLKRPVLRLIESLSPSADQWRHHNVLGLLHLTNEDIDAADKAFVHAYRLDPDRTLLRTYYVRFLCSTGRVTDALELMKPLADRHMSDASVQAQYGLVLFNKGMYSDAERVFARALACDSACRDAVIGLSLIYSAAGKPTTKDFPSRGS